MPLLPLYSFEKMQNALVALRKSLEALWDKIPEDDLKKMNEYIEAINKEIRSARF